MDYSTEIKNIGDAEWFLFALDQEGKMFHLEDDPQTIIDYSGNPIFSFEESILIRQRVSEIFMVMDDPFEYIMNLDSFRCVDDQERSFGI